jgi:transposase-like protein
MKKSYTATFKAQTVLELLKETKTLNQLASEYGVAASVLREWKLSAVKSLADVFEKRDSVTELKAAHERQVEDLYAEIGRLTTHVNFLKKSCPPEPRRTSGVGGA